MGRIMGQCLKVIVTPRIKKYCEIRIKIRESKFLNERGRASKLYKQIRYRYFGVIMVHWKSERKGRSNVQANRIKWNEICQLL